MSGFDVNRFINERSGPWRELEQLVARVETSGLPTIGLEGVRELGTLYRSASSDLIRARTELMDASVVDYLNDLVGRAHACVHANRRRSDRRLWTFLAVGFPRLLRSEVRLVLLSGLVLVAGIATGAIATALDPDARGALIPDDHQQHTPQERVSEETRTAHAEHASASFASFLFTHNIQVSFLVFALGLTFGVGTLSLMFYNGVPLGALAVQYHQAGHGLFFWAWILPHGIAELTVVVIAGGAGLILARALWLPGRRRRADALIAESRIAVRLVLGGMPLLVLAGVIEGTISQIHPPAISYDAKLAFAAIAGSVVYAYLILAGRKGQKMSSLPSPPDSDSSLPMSSPSSLDSELSPPLPSLSPERRG